jgi:hypothetical protein
VRVGKMSENEGRIYKELTFGQNAIRRNFGHPSSLFRSKSDQQQFPVISWKLLVWIDQCF